MVVYSNNPKAILSSSVRYKEEATCHADLKLVCKAIVKGWATAQEDSMQITVICGGITNLLYRVQYLSKSVLVRVYGEKTEMLIDREVDNAVFAELSKSGFAPMYHGRFLNGRIEGWFDARPLKPEEMGQPELSRFIATEMGRMHLEEPNQPRDPMLWKCLDKWLAAALDVSFEDDSNKAARLQTLQLSQFKEELRWSRAHIASSGVDPMDSSASPSDRAAAFMGQVVFCHNDVLSGNVLTADGWDRVQMIDFEYGGYNYRGFDIANHFCEYAGFDFDLAKWFPKRSQQLTFLEHYLSRSAGPLLQALHSEGANVHSAFMEAAVDVVNQYTLSSHMFWGLWAVMQARHSPIDFDFLDYARLRLSGYATHKAEFFGSAAATAAATVATTSSGSYGSGDGAAVAPKRGHCALGGWGATLFAAAAFVGVVVVVLHKSGRLSGLSSRSS